MSVEELKILPPDIHGQLQAFVHPSRWLKEHFPKVAERTGEPMLAKIRNNQMSVVDLNEDFFATVLGYEGMPQYPTIYHRNENRFYSYMPSLGIYTCVSQQQLEARLSGLLLEAAGQCSAGINVEKLQFDLRKTSKLRGVVERAKAHLEVPDDFFDQRDPNMIPCSNGVLHLQDFTFGSFEPNFQFRNRLSVHYDASAWCPRFLSEVLGVSMCQEDQDLFQRYCGMLLLGTNRAQVILVLCGPGNDGKGLLVRLITKILGHENVASLRTNLLTTRFEAAAYLGKTLLYGADVAPDFLQTTGASVLKSLTGGDPMDVELKNGNDRSRIAGKFNILITCNSLPVVNIQGDHKAWGRRLRIINMQRVAVSDIREFEDQLIAEEGPGILNWMLHGLIKLRDAGWDLAQSQRQVNLVDDLLLQSESVEVFAKERMRRATLCSLTIANCYSRYVEYCVQRNWLPVPHKQFAVVTCDWVTRVFHICDRNDIVGENGKQQRGWKGVACE